MAAELALPHRRRRDPFDDPGLDPQQLDDAMAQTQEQAGDPEPDPDPDPPDGGGASATDSDYTPPKGIRHRRPRPQRALRRAVFRTRTLVVPGVGEGAPGRRSRAAQPHRDAVSRPQRPKGLGVHVFATLLGRRASTAARPDRPRPVPTTYAARFGEGREGNLVIFVVDASGSMAARDRMAAVSGATLSLLRDAYQRRDKVAVITFRGRARTVLLPPTSSVHVAARRLARFDTGGKTPLAQGLLAARDVVVREKARDRARRSLVVVLTDGRATGGPIRSGGRGSPPRGWSPRAPPPSSSTAKPPSCGWGWPNSWRDHLGAPIGAAWRSCGPTTLTAQVVRSAA